MKKQAVLLLITLASLNSFAAGKSTIEGNIAGYKCKVAKGSLVFTGGENSEAKRRFFDLSSVSIFKEASVMSGGLEAATEGGIDFKDRESIVSSASLKGNMDRLYATVQQTKLFDAKGEKQITDVADLENENGFINEYKHVYSKVDDNGQSEILEVTVREGQITDHTGVKSATIHFKYKAPLALPAPIQTALDGTMDAKLNCKK